MPTSLIYRWNDDFCQRAYLNSISTKIHAGEYYQAINDYEDILLSGPPLQDSILAVIDAGMVYLLAELNGGGGTCGVQGTGFVGRIPSLRPADLADYQQKVAALWAMTGGQPPSWPNPKIPTAYAFHQNAPNPFNSSTTLRYDLPEDGPVKLQIFDVSGRWLATLVDGYRQAGTHQVTFDGSDLPSGIYLARLTVADFAQTQKMVLLK